MTRSRSLLPWAVWGSAVALYVIAIINRSSLAALGPAAQEHFGIDASTLATFPVIQLVVYAACQIPVGILIDRFGPSVLVLSGAAFMLVGQLVMATASEVWIAIAARVLVGAGDAGTFISVMRMLPEWFSARQIPTISQITGLLGQAGQLVSVTPLALLVDLFGWASGFFGICAVAFLFIVLGSVVLRDAPGRRTIVEKILRRTGATTRRSESLAAQTLTGSVIAPPATSLVPIIGGERAKQRSAQGREWFWTRIRRLVWIPGVRLAFWVHFSTPFAAQVFLLLWGTPFLTGGLDMSPATASGLLSIAIVSSMLVGVAIGPVSVRFAEYRVWGVIGVIIFIALVWLAVIVWPSTPPLWLIIVLMVAISIGGPVSMVAFDVARSHTPRSFAGFGTGFVNTGGFIATLTVLMGIGLLLDLQGAGSPENYSLHAFQLAFAVQIPVWIIGIVMLIIERKRTGAWMKKHGRTLR